MDMQSCLLKKEHQLGILIEHQLGILIEHQLGILIS